MCTHPDGRAPSVQRALELQVNTVLVFPYHNPLIGLCLRDTLGGSSIADLGLVPRTMQAPLLLRISSVLGTSFNRASGIFVTGSIGFVIGLLSSGFVSAAIRHRATLVLMIATVGLSLIGLSYSRPLVVYHLFFFLLNCGGGLYPASGVPSVAAIVPQARLQ